jgi:O-antigen/teichoic acid export membrane protein
MWVRLIVGIGLVALGWSVNGAVGALTLSFVGTWLVARLGARGLPADARFSKTDQRAALAFAGPVGAALIGQILINNSDVLIVKHFFAPVEAGHYAALALIGRIVFFATWSVVTVLLPAVAQLHQKGLPHRRYLWMSLGAVLAVSVIVTGGAFFFPQLVVGVLFGEAYLSIAPLLGLYAVATSLYSLANVVITYRLSIGNGRGGTLAVIGGTAQVIVLWFFHASLQQVVVVQIGLMTGLLALLLAWDWWEERR